MRLLDTVMDALNSLFPDFLRTPPAGSLSGAGSGKGGSPGGVEADSGFAATLVQFLGVRPTPQAREAGAEGLETRGTDAGVEESIPEGTGFPGEVAGSRTERVGLEEEGRGWPGGESVDGGEGSEGGEGGLAPWSFRPGGLHGSDGHSFAPGTPRRAGASPRMGTGKESARGVEIPGPGDPARAEPSPSAGAGAGGRPYGADLRVTDRTTGPAPRVEGARRPEPPVVRPGPGENPVPGPARPFGGSAPPEEMEASMEGEAARGRGDPAGGPAAPDGASTHGAGAALPDESARKTEGSRGPDPVLETDVATASGPGGSEAPAGAPAPRAPGFAGSVNRDPERLDPGFRTRLSRVVARMEAEYGHKVELLEGYRSPERQAALYEQGRTEPGRVVTWTRDSLHSEGRAADLQVDGRWDNPRGYARLQRIAAEEGLQTLGARDAGHVQLAEEGAGRAQRLSPEDGLGWPRGEGGISRPARVARVASPSGPARVARVARPARPGAAPAQVPAVGPRESGPVADAPRETKGRDLSGPSPESLIRGSDSSPREGGPAQQRATLAERVSPAPHSPPAQSRRLRDPDSSAEAEDGAGVASRSEASRDGSLSSQGGVQRVAAPAQGGRGAETIQRAGSVDRVSEVQALEESMSARVPGRVHLELEDADGMGTRLRLSLRGSQLSGSVDMADPAAALRMKNRVGELHEALARQGLDARALGLQGTRGLHVGRGAETELAALMQDPLAGLGRILESREGSMDPRADRQGQSHEESHRESGRFRDPPRRDRNKEEGK